MSQSRTLPRAFCSVILTLNLLSLKNSMSNGVFYHDYSESIVQIFIQARTYLRENRASSLANRWLTWETSCYGKSNRRLSYPLMHFEHVVESDAKRPWGLSNSSSRKTSSRWSLSDWRGGIYGQRIFIMNIFWYLTSLYQHLFHTFNKLKKACFFGDPKQRPFYSSIFLAWWSQAHWA